MKKLMIAAAIVCAAAISQGAAFTWSTSATAYTVPAGTKLVDGQTYDANTTTMKSVKDTWTWTAVFALTYDGQKQDSKIAEITYNINKIKVTNIDNNLFSLPTDDSTKTYSYSIVITGTDDDGNTLTSNAITGSKDFTKFATAAFATAVPSTWTYTAASVPEPTSAMLLLLGVAGLALKRKQK